MLSGFYFIIKIITTLFKVKCLNVINHSLHTIELRPSSTQTSPAATCWLPTYPFLSRSSTPQLSPETLAKH